MALKIPGYVLKREVGTGGMASVYLAVQKSLDRRVALKVMSAALAADQSFTKRFLREAKTVAALSHPNIVSIYDIGVTPGSQLHYFSMQYLPNGDFAQRIRKGVSETDIIHVAISIARALGYAHELGFVHRDVKPANILFDQTETPILTDFGIARAAAGSTRMTGTGVSVGTSHYMSPEQARGKDVDMRSDLYSLGAMVFEALAGKPPYEGEDGFAIAYSHVFDPVPCLPPDVEHWQPFIDRALAKAPADRYQCAEDMADDLRRMQGDENLILSSGSRDGQERTTPVPIISSGGRRRPPFDMRRSFENLWRVARGAPHGTRFRVTGGIESIILGALDGWRRISDTLLPFVPATYRPISLLTTFLLAIAVGAIVWNSQVGIEDIPIAESPPSVTDSSPEAIATPALDRTPVFPKSPDTADASTQAAEGSSLESASIAEQTADSVADTIDSLLNAAELDLEQNRLTTPSESNAFDRFAGVLALQSDHPRALAGIREIVQRYTDLASRSAENQSFRQAGTFLARASSVAEVITADDMQSEIDRLRQATAGAAAAAGFTARNESRMSDASRLFKDALLLDPGRTEVETALALIESDSGIIRFSDPLSDESLGPAMVIVALDTAPTADQPDEDLSPPVGKRIAVSAFEITVAQFTKFVESTDYYASRKMPACRDRESRWRSSRDRTWRAPGFPVNNDHPVTCVDWDAANAYSNWLSTETGFSYRMPSEMEWEALARESLTDSEPCTQGNVGDLWYKQIDSELTAYGCEDGWTYTAPVEAFEAGPLGISGLFGNVREWTADCWGERKASTGFSPVVEGDCDQRVVKGISWMNGENAAETGLRTRMQRENAYNTVGFRLVRAVD